MKPFEYFIRNGEVRTVMRDENLSKALMNDAEARLAYAKKYDVTEKTAKYVLENAYESLRESADAILANEGLKSYSHEASLIFLKKFRPITEQEIYALDRLRSKRNDSKYYGKIISIDDAEWALIFATKLMAKLKKIITANKKE